MATTKKTTTAKRTTKKATKKAPSKAASASTAKKPTTKRSTTRTTTKKVNKGTTFPEKELRQWLDGRSFWSHDDWLHLLDDLRTKGYNDYINTNGVDSIGLFLEQNRRWY